MHFLWIFFFFKVLIPFLAMVLVPDPVPVPDMVPVLVPVPVPDQTLSRSLVPVPPYLWSRPWSRSRSHQMSGPGLGPGPGPITFLVPVPVPSHFWSRHTVQGRKSKMVLEESYSLNSCVGCNWFIIQSSRWGSW